MNENMSVLFASRFALELVDFMICPQSSITTDGYQLQRTESNTRTTVAETRELRLLALFIEIPQPCCASSVDEGLFTQSVVDCGAPKLAVAP
jgi:hypothetical protein